MIGTPEQDDFISKNTRAVVTTLRRSGAPASSLIAFARDGDDLIFSTRKPTLKVKTLTRDPRVNLCVLDGDGSGFVSVEGTATIETDDIVSKHIAINRAMRGQPDWTPPEGFEARLRNEERVVVRVRAQRVSGVVGRR